MSTANYNNHTGGDGRAIVLKSFAELATVLDLEALPDGPADADPLVCDQASSPQSEIPSVPKSPSFETPAGGNDRSLDLTAVSSELAALSAGLESLQRGDARDREQATVELAEYEALLAEQSEAERSLSEARRVRAAAEQLAANAFTERARIDAARSAAAARNAELTCTRLQAARVRALEELASRPRLACALEDRKCEARRLADAEMQAEAERAQHAQAALAAAREARRCDRPDEALRILEPLVNNHPKDPELRSAIDAARWHSQHLGTVPAEALLRELLRRPSESDPESAVAQLAALELEGLSDDLARRVFGVWSRQCLHLVRQSGWLDPRRYSPRTSRGVVIARQSADGPYRVVSSLGLPGWPPGGAVTSRGVLASARPLLDR